MCLWLYNVYSFLGESCWDFIEASLWKRGLQKKSPCAAVAQTAAGGATGPAKPEESTAPSLSARPCAGIKGEDATDGPMRPSGTCQNPHPTAAVGSAVAGLAPVGPCPPDLRYSANLNVQRKEKKMFVVLLVVSHWGVGPKVMCWPAGPTVIEVLWLSRSCAVLMEVVVWVALVQPMPVGIFCFANPPHLHSYFILQSIS